MDNWLTTWKENGHCTLEIWIYLFIFEFDLNLFSFEMLKEILRLLKSFNIFKLYIIVFYE